MTSKPISPLKSESKAPSLRSAAPDPKGVSLMAEADKKLGKKSLMSLFTGGEEKYEGAIDLLHQAATQFKVSKNWWEAGDAYVKAAEIYQKNLKSINDAASDYVNAAKAFKNVGNDLALKHYQLAVDLYMGDGKLSQAARLWKEIGELQEKEMQPKNAAFSYQKAADCYHAEDSKVNASSCQIKVAELLAEDSEYPQAIDIFEKISNESVDGPSKWSVKDWLFKALLCNFILAAGSKNQDMGRMDDKIERYQEILPSLSGTRELKLVQDCVAAFRDDDVDKFTDVVFRYDEIMKLDNWTARILLDVKKALSDGPTAKEQSFE